MLEKGINWIGRPLLPLSWTPLFSKELFYVNQSNEEAFRWIHSWPWPSSSLCLYGPSGCGKTHLGTIWAQSHTSTWEALSTLPQVKPHATYVIDNVDQAGKICEEKVLSFFNEIQIQKATCLWLAQHPPSQWDFQLPDLVSRLRAMTIIPIHRPDDTLLARVLTKSLEDIGLKIPPRVVTFLLRRMPRSFGSVKTLVSFLKEYQGPKVFTLETLKQIIKVLHEDPR